MYALLSTLDRRSIPCLQLMFAGRQSMLFPDMYLLRSHSLRAMCIIRSTYHATNINPAGAVHRESALDGVAEVRTFLRTLLDRSFHGVGNNLVHLCRVCRRFG